MSCAILAWGIYVDDIINACHHLQGQASLKVSIKVLHYRMLSILNIFSGIARIMYVNQSLEKERRSQFDELIQRFPLDPEHTAPPCS